ncbi:MAG: transcriptional regulator, TetR family [Desulfomicrobiaceae bacterium]|nr:transcriptional regulator, TetR family [Desulfomicrobiaceae bacterium]
MARRQQEKSAQTQQELLEAAERLFVEKGYLATTVQEITEAAGYAKGNFYRY